MTAWRGSGSKTRAAALSDPSEVRVTPSFFWTLASSLAVWMLRRLVRQGLKKYRRRSEA